MRAHFATYWRGIRGELAVYWIAELVHQSVTHGFDTISLFGEVSPFHAGAELNYHALENFGSAANPKADLDAFLRDVAGPLLGGEERARDYLRFARLVSDRERIAEALEKIYSRLSALPRAAARRWAWLANHLASFAYPE
jgi:hypothetical protein